MQWVVLADEALKEELLSNGVTGEFDLVWIRQEKDFIGHKSADGFIDLLFDETEQRIELLKTFSAKPVIINSVIATLKKINVPFVRINAWPGFLKRPVVEASCDNENMKRLVEKIFSGLNKKTEWVTDEPGFITAKIVSAIINEAYFALEEKVSSKDEIDTAMKLGTNYPYGPFEWSKKIDIKKIYRLLEELSKTNSRYQPARLLAKEAME
jgi:3-hydroxybutyryl-CoA dehydrogenase